MEIATLRARIESLRTDAVIQSNKMAELLAWIEEAHCAQVENLEAWRESLADEFDAMVSVAEGVKAQRDEARRLLEEAIAEDCLSQSGPPYGPERVHVLSERLVKCIKAHLAKGEYERGRVDGREEAEGMSE